MRDDRLADAKVFDDGVLVIEYRHGYIDPALVQAMGELSRDVAHSDVIDLDFERAGREPTVMAWMEPGALDDKDPVMIPRVSGGDGLPPSFEIRCRSQHIDPALLREVNEYALPMICGLLVPRHHVRA